VTPTPTQRLAAEFIATAGLLAAVVGSGIMGESLAGGNVAIALLANTLATGAALVALILTFGPISGAHMNPVVTMVEVLEKRATLGSGLGYLLAQVAGAVAGVWLAHVMFDQAIFMTSEHVRSGSPQLVSEAVATFGLLCTILGTASHRPAAIPFAVGAYIAAAYWFTASTSFANPAVTFARTLTNTFAGIRPIDAPGFIAAQFVGALLALATFRWLRTGQRHKN
jgi:glycerol uptake facilitator-like aquaporin